MNEKTFFALGWLAIANIGISQELEIANNASPNSFSLAWESVPDRSYFLQVSDTLDEWEYSPMIYYSDGTTQGTNGGITNGQNLFFRLISTDQTVVGSNPGTADFDGDGLTNLSEIATHGTNPFLGDTDRDWLTDFDEVTWNVSDARNPDRDTDGIDDGNEDFDNDGWANYYKLALTSPVTTAGTWSYAPEYLFVGPVGNQRLAMRFRNIPGSDHGYHYRIQGSSNLFTWTDINHYENGFGPALPAGVLGSADSVPVPDGTGAHEFTVQAPIGSGYQYLRLGVNEPFPGYVLRTADVTAETLKVHSDAHFDRLVPNNVFSRQIFDYYKHGEDCVWARWCWTNQVD